MQCELMLFRRRAEQIECILGDNPAVAFFDPQFKVTCFDPGAVQKIAHEAVQAADLPSSTVATIEWVRGPEPLVAGRDRPLRFVVRDSDGRPAPLEPYLGMPAHAVVTRVDGSVFAHLHPIGTVSPASQMALTLRTPADTVPGSLARRLAGMGSMGAMGDPAAGPPGEFAIPYGFPSPGRYRLWVQVRLRGAVETGVFDAYVSPTAGNRSGRPLAK